MFGKKWFILFFAICLGLATLSFCQAADPYPSRGIELVIPWAPGGSTDISGRIFANELTKVLKVPNTPVNKPGASGTIGATYVYKAKKDGYILFGGSLGWLLGSITLEGVPYDPLKDFIPISNVSSSPHGIFVRNESPFKKLEDVVEAAKKSPRSLSAGHAGTASDGHFNLEIFQKAAGIAFKQVPFKGNAEIPPAILGGHVDIGIGVASSWLNFVKAGSMRVLTVTGSARLKDLPNVPTFKEQGFKQGFLNNWVGFFAPAGVPAEVVERLAQASEKVVKLNAFIEAIEKTGSVAEFLSPADYRKSLEDERKVTDGIATELGLKKK
jgi:tripartite-type tricarboxylate transporter receptor subunit TctC